MWTEGCSPRLRLAGIATSPSPRPPGCSPLPRPAPGAEGLAWPYLRAPPARPCRTAPRPGSGRRRCRRRCRGPWRPAAPGSTRCRRRRRSAGCSRPAAPRPGGVQASATPQHSHPLLGPPGKGPAQPLAQCQGRHPAAWQPGSTPLPEHPGPAPTAGTHLPPGEPRVTSTPLLCGGRAGRAGGCEMGPRGTSRAGGVAGAANRDCGAAAELGSPGLGEQGLRAGVRGTGRSHPLTGVPGSLPPGGPGLTLYHMMSGSGLPSTTTAKRGVSPSPTSRSSMMDSKRGGSGDRETFHP